MRILRCRIQNFGKLSNLELEFENGCNVIYGENGWGKSTLAMFLKVMFFGFSNGGKRTEWENDRKRYKPWQGGVYGGSLTFETEHRTYIITRTFGKNEKEDLFQLRDAETNLDSGDFSENIGEELFQINGEAFLNTIFVFQNNCSTRATDSVNAKIGNLSEDLDDIGRYDEVNKRIKEWLNKHSPTRKTGELRKEREEIEALEQQVQGISVLEQSAQALEQLAEEKKILVQSYKEKQKELRQKQKEMGVYLEAKMLKEQYQELQRNEIDRKQAVMEEKAWFPGDIPLKDELERWLSKSMELPAKREAVRIYEEPDLEKLAYYEGKDLERLCKEAEEEEKRIQEERIQKENLKVQTGSPFESRDWMVIAGIILLGIGIGMALNLSIGVDAAIGIGCGVLGFILVWLRKIRAAAGEKNRDVLDTGDETEAAQSLSELRLEWKEYEALRMSHKKHLHAKEEYENLRQEIEDYIRNLSFEPWEGQEAVTPEEEKQSYEERFLEQLFDIQKHANHYRFCWEEWQSARERLEAFQRKHKNLSQTLKIEQPTEQLSPEALEMELNHLESELEGAYDTIQLLEQQLKESREQLEALKEQKEALAAYRQQYDLHKTKYTQIGKTGEYLEEARNRLVSKYMEPIQKGIRKYLHMITEESGEAYQLDAKIKLFTEAYGVRREVELLSTGWQDLTGLCMRMALVDAMHQEEKPFLIMDDPFVNLDDAKVAGGERFLREIGREYQILYFTCQKTRCFKMHVEDSNENY